MKTAITETIQLLEFDMSISKGLELEVLTRVVKFLNQQLPKEREQIEQAYDEGGQNEYENKQGKFSVTPQEYFKQTYTL
jgi:hypothetical protein